MPLRRLARENCEAALTTNRRLTRPPDKGLRFHLSKPPARPFQSRQHIPDDYRLRHSQTQSSGAIHVEALPVAKTATNPGRPHMCHLLRTKQ
jgi:hypothetical protein